LCEKPVSYKMINTIFSQKDAKVTKIFSLSVFHNILFKSLLFYASRT